MRKIISLILFMSIIWGSTATKSKAATLEAKLPTANELSEQMFASIAEKQHPYIAYEESDVPALKAKIETGYSKKAFECIKETAEKYLSATTPMSGGIAGRQLQSYVAYLSTYTMLSGDEKYAQKAVSLVTDAAARGDTDTYYAINVALAVADFGYAYALAYDWLYNYMTEEQRKLIRDEMVAVGEWLYRDSQTNNTWGADTPNRKAWNWNAVCHGALGMISISLREHREWLTLAIERIKGYYTYAVDSTGAGVEGLHYIGYGMNSAIPLNYMIYRTTGIELIDYYPNIQKVPEWSMRMNAPFGNEQAAIGQGTKLDNYASTFYIISRYSQSTELWGWERTYALENGSGFPSDYAGNGFSAPWVIFYENKQIAPKAPDDQLQLVKTFDKGVVIAKDGWDKNSSMMTFTCGWGYEGCWNHPDDNTFTFFAKGESFVIDLGAGYKKSTEHNQVAVDGGCMYYEGGATMIKGNILKNTTLKNGALYLKGDNSDSYRDEVLYKNTRQIIYKGGDTPYLIAFDHVVAGGGSHVFTTNYYTDNDSKISIDGTHATIIGGNVGNIGHAFAYSTGEVGITLNKTDKTQAVTVTNNADTHDAATVFITNNADGTSPLVTFDNQSNGVITIEITYNTNNAMHKDKYILSDSSDVPYVQSSIDEFVSDNDGISNDGGNVEASDNNVWDVKTKILIGAVCTLVVGAATVVTFKICSKKRLRKK